MSTIFCIFIKVSKIFFGQTNNRPSG